MAEEKTIQSVINDLKTSRNNIATAIGNKGVTVPSGTKLSGLASLVDSIERPELQSKTVTPTTSNQTINPDNGYNGLSQVTVNAIPNQKTEDDVTASGATVTVPAGYYASKVEKSVQTAERAKTTARVYVDGDGDLAIEASNNQAEGYVSAANKTVTRYVYLSANGATVTADCDNVSISKSVTTATRAATSITTTADDTNDVLTLTASNNQETGYGTGSNQTSSKAITLMVSGSTVTATDNSATPVKISKSVATATQATPSIAVSAGGIVTATVLQAEGYVSAGTKSATKQLTTQAAKTVTPTTSDQTAVASNRYTTGAVKVKGDANLVAGNIKKGVSIFGVTGTFEGGANIATCTVNIKWSVTARNALITATTFANGAISRFVSKTGSGTVTIPNVVCGSVITVYTGTMTSVYGWSYGKEYSWDNFTHALTVPTSAGTYTAEIGVLDD